MPTYKNENAFPVYWRNMLWNPGETKAVSNGKVPYDERLSLTKISDEPKVSSPVLVSEDVTLVAGVAQTKVIPYSPRIVVSAVAISGTASIFIGDSEDGITLDAHTGLEGTVYEWSSVGSIGLVSTAGATVRLLVEGVL